MKYNVESRTDSKDQYEGRIPHDEIRMNPVGDYIEADTPEEAISYGIDWFCDRLAENGTKYDRHGDEEVVIYDDFGEVYQCEFDFVATEIEE